jgi:superfamily II DNA or RNA helicase
VIQLRVNNSYSKISGLSPLQEKELRELLSYTVDAQSAYFSGSYGPRKKCLLSKRGEFPTGLIHRLPSWPMEVLDDRVKPIPKPMKSVVFQTPYPWQTEACAIAYQKQQGTISACTGTGKSRVIAMIAARLGLNTLVVVPTLEIKKQLISSLITALGPKHKVTVENIDSSALKIKKNYDCLIIDEAHHAAAKTYQKLNKTVWTDIYYRFFLTATAFRNNSEETLLFESIAGQLIYKLDYRAAVKKGYIVPIEAYYIEMPKQKTEAYVYQEVYKELVVNHQERNEAILRLLISLNNAGKSTLCLVKEVQHGRNIGHPSFVTGEDQDSRSLISAFNTGRLKTMVATTGIMGEGVDSRACEFVIIAGLGKAKSQFMQQCGRAVRTYPGKESAKIILIKDRSHKYLTRHFNEQIRILRDEYGIAPIKLEI